MPFERSLVRYKRTISSVMPTPINTLLSLLEFNDVRSTDKNFMTFISDLLTGKDIWSEITSANISTLLNQFKKINIVVREIMTLINASFDKIFEMAKVCFLNLFLPILYMVLNKAKDTGLLPSQISAMIEMFNLCYKFLQLTGYVPK